MLGVVYDWQLVNGISGFVVFGEVGYFFDVIVEFGGQLNLILFMWVVILEGCYLVVDDNISVIFCYVGCEDGLDIDSFVFVLVGVFYMVEQFEDGLFGVVLLLFEIYMFEGLLLVDGKLNFFGGVCCGNQCLNFEVYWNQVIVENVGKWGLVEVVWD